MGYTPNSMAVGLSRYKDGTKIPASGAVLAWLGFRQEPGAWRQSDELRRYWQGAQQEAEHRGYLLEEFAPAMDWSAEQIADRLVERNVSGLLLPPGPPTPRVWQALCGVEIPKVLLGHIDAAPACVSVAEDAVNNAVAAYSATAMKGYRRIGLICDGQAPGSVLTLAGVLCAQTVFRDHAVVPPLELGVIRPHDHEAAVGRWFRQHRPDAVMIERLEQLRLPGAGFQFPAEVGVVLLDLPKECENGLAGIRRNAEEIGRLAVEVLVAPPAEADDELQTTARRFLVEGDWIDGLSLPPLP